MNLIYSKKCPVCDLQLIKREYNRHDEYKCANQCYQFNNLFEQCKTIVIVNAGAFSIRFVTDSDKDEMHVYACEGFIPPIGAWIGKFPIMEFEWDNLNALSDRIKNLLVFL